MTTDPTRGRLNARIAIVGAGSIGVGWAVAFARAGCEVALQDPDAARLHDAMSELSARLSDLASFGLLQERPSAVLARVTTHAELEPTVAGAVHVQECAPESLALKRQLFSTLVVAAPSDAALASSSSGIVASQIAEDLPTRERCLVVHPGNPPYLLPVVEVAPAPFTSEEVVARTESLLASAGMSPVRVRREIEGLIFNRLQGAVLREAYCLVRDEVATVEDIDRVMRDGLGRRWSLIGPFETSDLNVRGGLQQHAERMGPAYARMGAERGQHDPWTEELVQKAVGQRRQQLPLDLWEARVRWRDRALMTLDAARREIEPFDPPVRHGLGSAPTVSRQNDKLTDLHSA